MTAHSPTPSEGHINTDLTIIGAGAAGLMAGAVAGESGLRAVVIERKHRPGLKLLMCGNNRCNVSHDFGADVMAAQYSEGIGDFLSPAIQAFSPRKLCRWFAANRLQTTVHDDGRIFPRSEKADDVLHCFTDVLRDRGIPIIYNAPVTGLEWDGAAWVAKSDRLSLRSRYVLVATGGVSYPKTGSVGDGQRFAKQLGHRVLPYRPGLVGLELDGAWLKPGEDISIPDTVVELVTDGKTVGQTSGEILLTRSCARGPAMVNVGSVIGRLGLREVSLVLDLCPQIPFEELRARCATRVGAKGKPDWGRFLGQGILPKEFSSCFARNAISATALETDAESVARMLKAWHVDVSKVRPLKEAMVTIGGVDLREIDAQSMESRLCPGLFFAGEVLDIDGPTGGYNLHAAFATARLAVSTIADRCGLRNPVHQMTQHSGSNRRKGRGPRSKRHQRGQDRRS